MGNKKTLIIITLFAFLSSAFLLGSSKVDAQEYYGDSLDQCAYNPPADYTCPADCDEIEPGLYCSQTTGPECGGRYCVEHETVCGPWELVCPSDGYCRRLPGISCSNDSDCGGSLFGPCIGASGCYSTRDCDDECVDWNQRNWYYCWEWCCTICSPGDCGTCDPNSWSDTSSCTASCGGGTKTQANDCGDTRTVNCNTQSCSVDVTGYIWDSTDLSCGADKPSNAITSADVEGDVTPVLDGNSGTWDSGDGSYAITGVNEGNNKSLSADPESNEDLFKYALKCLNNSTDNVVGNSAIIDVNGNTTAHLGYELISSGWFQAIDGSIYAGGNAIESLSVGLPSTASPDFTNYLINGPGGLFTTTLFSVEDADGDTNIVDNSDNSLDNNKYYFESMNENDDESYSFWPEAFTFNPPTNVQDTGDINDLEAGSSYDLGSNPDALSGSYTVDGDGIAVVYASGTLTIDGELTSSNDNRILFVVDGSVVIADDIGAPAPTASTAAHIQAGILAKGSIEFATGGTENDTTIIVESPIAARDGSISFERDRGIENGYPAEVVRFNPIYVSQGSDLPVSLVDITWLLEN